MNRSERTSSDPLADTRVSLGAERELDAICEAFVRDWRAGQRPLIEEYLHRVAESSRGELLAELLRQELTLRRAAGETMTVDEYRTRFVADREVVQNVFATVLTERSVASTLGFSDSRERRLSVDQALPQRVGDYAILEEIARGGMGVVYKARQLSVNRIVALKMMLSGQFAGEEERSRFHLEAEAAGQLDHPNIVPVYEAGTHDGRPFLSMGFVDGLSLRGLLAQGPLAPRDAATMARSMALAVHYAHTKGIVHRDLKPQNVLVDAAGQPRITDFGLAKVLATDSGMTTTGQILGTPSYMPPEQAAGRIDQIGPASDVYSLGATLYNLLTGRPPFQAASTIETIQQVLQKEPVSLVALNSAVPRDLETICLKCLHKEPFRRYESAQALADDLGRFLAGEPIRARPFGALERVWRWCRRKPLAAGLIAASVAILIFGAAGVFYRNQYLTTEGRLADAQKLRQVHECYALLNKVREMVARPRPGWTWEALDILQRAVQMRTPEMEMADIESLAAEALTRRDVRTVAVLAPGIQSEALAFTRDGERLAIAQMKHALQCVVQVYSTTDHQLLKSYSFSTAGTSLGKLFSGTTNYQEGILSLAWSPDGRWLVAGTRFGKLIRWDTQDNSPIPIEWQAHQDRVRQIVFSSDGQTLYSMQDSLKKWNAADQFQEIPVADNAVFSLDLSRDGTLAAIYNAAKQHCGFGPHEDEHWLNAAHEKLEGRAPVFSPDGRFLVILAENGARVRVLDARDGDEVISWSTEDENGRSSVARVHYTTDGSTLVGADDRNRLRFWDVCSGKEVLPSLPTAFTTTVVVSPCGRWIALTPGKEAGTTELLAWRSPMSCFILAEKGAIRGLDLSPDGQSAAVVTHQFTEDEQRWVQLNKWNLASRELGDEQRFIYPWSLAQLADSLPSPVAWDPVGGRVAWHSAWCGLAVTSGHGLLATDVFASHPDTVTPNAISPERFADPETSPHVKLNDDPSAPFGKTARFSQECVDGNGGLALPLDTLTLEGHAGGWLVAADVEANLSDYWKDVFELAIHSAGNQLAQSTHTEVRDLPRHRRAWYGLVLTHQDHAELKGAKVHIGIRCNSNEGHLAVRQAMLFPVKIERSTSTLMPLDYGALAWSPDGRRLWGTFDDDKQVAAWEATDFSVAATWNNRLSELAVGVANINSLVAGNSIVACGNRSGVVHVLPVGEGELLSTSQIPGPGGAIRAMALAPDETWVAIGTQSGKLQLRSVARGEVLSELADHPAAIVSLALSRVPQEAVHQGGTKGGSSFVLATADANGVIRLFRVHGPSSVRPWLTLDPHIGEIHTLRISATGEMLLAAPRRGSGVRGWNLNRMGSELTRLGLED